MKGESMTDTKHVIANEIIDAKPRTPKSLKDMIESARKLTAQGWTVYMRDCETGRTLVMGPSFDFSRLTIDDPSRMVVGAAVR